MHRYAVPDLRWLGICSVHLQGVAQDTFQMLSNRDRLVSGLAWTSQPIDHDLCDRPKPLVHKQTGSKLVVLM